MKVGNLVVPIAEREYMFLENADGEADETLDEVEWTTEFGIVLHVGDFDPPREYMRVRVLVGKTIGWTYTDYLREVSFDD